MNNIGPCYFTVAPMWPKSYHTTGPKITFLRHLVGHRILSKTLVCMCINACMYICHLYYLSVSQSVYQYTNVRNVNKENFVLEKFCEWRPASGRKVLQFTSVTFPVHGMYSIDKSIGGMKVGAFKTKGVFYRICFINNIDL